MENKDIQLNQLIDALNKAHYELVALQQKKQELLKRFEMSIGLDQSELFAEMKKNQDDFEALNKKSKLILEKLKALNDGRD